MNLQTWAYLGREWYGDVYEGFYYSIHLVACGSYKDHAKQFKELIKKVTQIHQSQLYDSPLSVNIGVTCIAMHGVLIS